MYIDDNLKWNVHIDIVPKISAKIGVLRSLRKIIPTATLRLLYNAIVLPHFNYDDVVYDSATETSHLFQSRDVCAQIDPGYPAWPGLFASGKKPAMSMISNCVSFIL